MKRTALLALALVPVLLASSIPASAHCEVPCGIFDDPARFAAMQEDASTIAKAMGQIGELAGKTDAQSMNQLIRWVNTKEEHATHTMDTIGQYFMAQRIKVPAAGDEAAAKRYVSLLSAAHRVSVAAMKCKQSVDPANAAALSTAISTLQKIYTTK